MPRLRPNRSSDARSCEDARDDVAMNTFAAPVKGNYESRRRSRLKYEAKRKAARREASRPCAAFVSNRLCRRWGKYRGVCWDHLTPELRTHYRILARIRSFPDRDILGS